MIFLSPLIAASARSVIHFKSDRAWHPLARIPLRSIGATATRPDFRTDTGLSAPLPAPCRAVPDIAIRRSPPCEAGKRAHGHPHTTPMRSVDGMALGNNATRADGLGKTKTNVVVPVVRRVPVTVGRTYVPRFVVPGAAADHTPVASRSVPLRKTDARKDGPTQSPGIGMARMNLSSSGRRHRWRPNRDGRPRYIAAMRRKRRAKR